MKKTALLLLFSCIAWAQMASKGKLDMIQNFASNYVDARNVAIWLPENYSKKEQYNVLYMHDGQALFDPSTTWNKQAWNVDDTTQKLITENKIQKCIIVGVYNNPMKRHIEYFPQKAYKLLNKEDKKRVTENLQQNNRIKEEFKPISDSYLKFLVEELKPYIDQNYSVFTDKEHTFIAGSSMGGLISMYAVCEYPEVFGGAACISTHWPGVFAMDKNPIPDSFLVYLRKNIPNPENHKFYFDCGNMTLDANYLPLQKEVDAMFKEKEYTSKNYLSLFFEGKDHSENSWAERFSAPLEFLLAK